MNKKIFIELIPGTKRSVDSWTKKSNRLKTEDAEMLSDIGVVVPEGYAVLDADNQASIDKIEQTLNTLGVKFSDTKYLTDNGAHYVFKCNKTVKLGSNTKVGIWDTKSYPMDIRANNKAIVKIKGDGKTRVNPTDFINMLECAPTIPYSFAIKNKFKIHLNEYSTAGRDNTAFKWVAILRTQKWDNQDIVNFLCEIAKLNGDNENESQTREWALAKVESSVKMGEVVDYNTPAYNGFGYIDKLFEESGITKYTSVLEYDVAYNNVIEGLSLTRDSDDNQVWGFDAKGAWKALIGGSLEYTIGNFLNRTLINVKPSVVSEILSGIKYVIPEKEAVLDEFIVSFSNTDWDIESNSKFTKRKGTYIKNVIPHNLITKQDLESTHKDANIIYNTLMENWSNNDKDTVTELEEMIGIALSKSTRWEKIWFLQGDGSNGKSWFFKFLQFVLGKQNYSSEEFSFLSSNIFSSANLYSKLANLNPDISSGIIKDSTLIKRISSGDTISSQYKGKDSFTFTPYATLISGVNSIPYIKDYGSSMGVDRRIKVIVFDKDFDYSKKSNLKKTDILDNKIAEVAIYHAVNALNRIIKSGTLTTSRKAKYAIQSYLEELNNVGGYLDNNPIKSGDKLKTVWQDYKQWCNDYSMIPYGYREFEKKLVKYYKINAIDIDVVKSKEHHKGDEILEVNYNEL